MQTSPPRLLVPTVFALSLVVLQSREALAAPIAYDSFQTTTTGTGGTYNSTYNANGQLFGQNPTATSVGFNGAWSNGGASTTGDLRAETSGLTHPLLEGVPANGDVFATQNTLLRVANRPFSATVNTAVSGQEAANGDIWFGGLVVSAQAPTGTSPILFGLSANTLYNLPTSTGVMFGVDDGAIRLYVNGVQTGGAGFSITTGVTYLVAAHIDFTAGGTLNDSVTLEIFSPSAPLDTPTASISASGLTIDPVGLRYLSITRTGSTNYSTNADTPRFDEFRLGLLATAVAVPEPASEGLLGMAIGLFLAVRRRGGRR